MLPNNDSMIDTHMVTTDYEVPLLKNHKPKIFAVLM